MGAGGRAGVSRRAPGLQAYRAGPHPARYGGRLQFLRLVLLGLPWSPGLYPPPMLRRRMERLRFIRFDLRMSLFLPRRRWPHAAGRPRMPNFTGYCTPVNTLITGLIRHGLRRGGIPTGWNREYSGSRLKSVGYCCTRWQFSLSAGFPSEQLLDLAPDRLSVPVTSRLVARACWGNRRGGISKQARLQNFSHGGARVTRDWVGGSAYLAKSRYNALQRSGPSCLQRHRKAVVASRYADVVIDLSATDPENWSPDFAFHRRNSHLFNPYLLGAGGYAAV